MTTQKRPIDDKRKRTQAEGAKRRTAQIREHYRRFRVQKPGGKYYNPILDDPATPGERHPENIRGYTHGTLEGYRDAGCTYCEPCAAAGRAENQRQEERRLTNRLDDHRTRVASLLAGRFPDLPAEVLADSAELVVRTHRVRQKYNALLDYYPTSVELALNNWALVSHVELDIADIPDLAATIIEELSS